MTHDLIDQLTEQTVGMLETLARTDPDAPRVLPAAWEVLAEGAPATIEQIAAAADLPVAAVAARLNDPQVEMDNRGCSASA